MSAANVIPLFPERKPAVNPKAAIAAHRPCPDLCSHSLNQEQKERGLENIAKVRKQIREKKLAPLRAKAAELKAKGKQSEDRGEQMRIKTELKKLTSQAAAIEQRWS